MLELLFAQEEGFGEYGVSQQDTDCQFQALKQLGLFVCDNEFQKYDTIEYRIIKYRIQYCNSRHN